MAVPVLVVDDNEGFLRVMRVILEGEDPPFATHTALSGSEALAFLDRRPPFTAAPRPAFIVLDFYLPDMNAPTVLGRLDLSIPVLVLSQADWEEDERAARAAGAHAFAVKPSGVRALRDLVVGFWEEHVHGGPHPAH